MWTSTLVALSSGETHLAAKICRVVPAIVARNPWILSFPTPQVAGRRVEENYARMKRKISSRLMHELEIKALTRNKTYF